MFEFGFRLMALGWFLLTATHCSEPFAKTYYIDFEEGSDANQGIAKEAPWKRSPGMRGFRGTYRHHAGDSMIFKGGGIWPQSTLPLSIKHSGTARRSDAYTSDRTWFRGAAWAQPVLDARHSLTPLIVADKQSHFVIDDLKLVDYGSAGIANDGKAIDMHACEHFIIRRCTVAPQSWIGLYIHSYSGKTESDILIDGNDISSAGQAIAIAVEAPHSQMHRVTISRNSIHDLASQIVGQTHGDGIHTWNSAQNDPTQFIRDLTIRDNRFYGDFSRVGEGTASMTSMIYVTDPGKRAIITGNSLSYTKTTRFASLIWVRSFDSVLVEDNTLVMDTAQGNIGIIIGQGGPGKRVEIKNNRFHGAKYCYYIYPDAVATTRIDGNACVTTGPTVAYWDLVGKTWPEWQAMGHDIRGTRTAPPIPLDAP
jgi:Right handed beta helix region